MNIIKMFNDRKGAIGAGTIKGIVVAILMLTVLISMLPSLILTNAEAVYDLSTMYAANSTYLGADAAALGANVNDWTGWFWVIGPLLMLITTILGLFMIGGRK